MMRSKHRNYGLLFIVSLLTSSPLFAAEDLERALRRAKYLLNGTMPNDTDFSNDSTSVENYRNAVRGYLTHDNFYDTMIRYHERVFGTGLKDEYLEELLLDEIDNKQNKFARIQCGRQSGSDRFSCDWASAVNKKKTGGRCPASQEQAVSVFWYPGIVAWVCPSVATTCGSDLSRCFIEHADEAEARFSEIGTTEAFDSRYAVIRSLERQSAGLASAVVVENYPYTKILEPGLSAVDGAIAHFYRQSHHFKIDGLHLPQSLIDSIDSLSLTDTRFKLVNTGSSYESAGVLTTFGWLRRYDKNRTRANQLYERLLCRKFTSELPRVFPADPGNLRETEGCSGCHAVLDPLADFFNAWGEGGDFYTGKNDSVSTYFNGQSGSYLSELSNIVSTDRAFAACQVQHVWDWLVGRSFYHDEAELRDGLTDYFINSNYSFRELTFAVATHPTFLSDSRSDGVVTDPLEEPPLGTEAGISQRSCDGSYSYSEHIAPNLTYCTGCHGAGDSSRQDLTTEAAWRTWGSQAFNMMASGTMPPGQFGPEVTAFTENVRCWVEQEGL